MIRLIAAMIALGISIDSLAEDDPSSDKSERVCAVLTWPDGHKTSIVTNYKEQIRFFEVCGKAPGTCKLDAKPFDPDSDGKAFAHATVECLVASPGDGRPSPSRLEKNRIEVVGNSSELCTACQLMFSDQIYPESARRCSAQTADSRTDCIGRTVAGFYLRKYEAFEFLTLYRNLSMRCPSPQAREYFKARLYYLATELGSEDMPLGRDKDFDFGPVDFSILGPLEVHPDPAHKVEMYQRAIAKHGATPNQLIQRFVTRCKDAQPGAPADAR